MYKTITDIAGFLFCTGIITLIFGSIIFAICFASKKTKKEQLEKKDIIKIYLITFVIIGGFLLIASFSKPETTSGILVVVSVVAILFLLLKARGVPKKGQTGIKKIKETKCSCQACGNVWYYGKQEVQEINRQNFSNFSRSLSNVSNSAMCCSGCLPAAYLPRQEEVKVKDLNKCPKCNSQAIKKEEVIHEV
jgi:hypothetical protein